jgi:hypothetical protein
MWTPAHVVILVVGIFGLVAIYTGAQFLTSNFMKHDNGKNPARIPILISLVNGAAGILFLALFLCFAFLW